MVSFVSVEILAEQLFYFLLAFCDFMQYNELWNKADHNGRRLALTFRGHLPSYLRG